MRKFLEITGIILIAALFVGCPKGEVIARDAIAGAQAWIRDEQVKNQTTCTANPSQEICKAVNRVIAAQRTTGDALAVYCEGTPPAGQTAYKDGGPCVPVKTSGEALRAAVGNLNALLNDAKAIGGK